MSAVEAGSRNRRLLRPPRRVPIPATLPVPRRNTHVPGSIVRMAVEEVTSAYTGLGASEFLARKVTYNRLRRATMGRTGLYEWDKLELLIEKSRKLSSDEKKLILSKLEGYRSRDYTATQAVSRVLRDESIDEKTRDKLAHLLVRSELLIYRRLDEHVRRETGMGLLEYIEKMIYENKKDPETVAGELAGFIAVKTREDPVIAKAVNSSISKYYTVQNLSEGANYYTKYVVAGAILMVMGLLRRLPGGENVEGMHSALAGMLHNTGPRGLRGRRLVPTKLSEGTSHARPSGEVTLEPINDDDSRQNNDNTR